MIAHLRTEPGCAASLIAVFHQNQLTTSNAVRIFMRIPLILTLALLATGIPLRAADAPTPDPNNTTTVRSQAVNDPLNVLRRVDAWQENQRATSERRFAEEARWFQGRLAAYRATAEVVWLNRIDEWLNHNTDALPTVADPVAALRAAQVAIGFHTSQHDTLTTAVPASWDAWRDTVLAKAPTSAQVLGGLPAFGMVGTIKHNAGNKNAERVQWFALLHQRFAAIWDANADPSTGLLGGQARLADQAEAALGLAQILADVPRKEVTWTWYADHLRAMSTALLARQGANGLWATDLGNGAGDLAGIALVVSALAQGVDLGILDAAATGPALAKGWGAIAAGVDGAGRLGGRLTPNADEAGAVLLAAAGMIRLQRLLDNEGRPLPTSNSPLLPTCGISVHPLSVQLVPLVERAATATFEPTGFTRRDYLRVIAREVGFFRQHQSAEGRIIDPALKPAKEFHYATPCYAHAAATLVASGADRSPEMLDSAMRALDVATSDLLDRSLKKIGNIAPGSDVNTSDFYARPVMGAYLALKEIAPKERVAMWEQRLSALDPVKTYSAPNGSWGNWTACNLWGEFLRYSCGWQSQAYIDHNLDLQRWHITPLGYYFEGHGPYAYDGFGRYFMVGILFDGYHGPLADTWRDGMWRGAWSALAVQSPAGEMPIGGRSAHHIWVEAENASIFEMYATTYAKAGHPVEAGMFKRGALLALRSIDSWIALDGSGQVVKNWYPPTDRHGYMSYSHFASYNMSAMSMLASAWAAANDAVAERPAPADLGGILVCAPELKSIVANAGGAYVQYLTVGDQHHDPTGLVRVHIQGCSPQLGPSSGVIDDAAGRQGTPWAIGPVWTPVQGIPVRLAGLRAPGMHLIASNITSDAVTFNVSGTLGQEVVTEEIRVCSKEVRVMDHWQSLSPGTLMITYPALTTDGVSATDITEEGNRVALQRQGGGGVAFEVLEPASTTLTRSGLRINHPNGFVEPILGVVTGDRLVYRIRPAAAKP
jgi:Glycosyl Hydrolase Family 88